MEKTGKVPLRTRLKLTSVGKAHKAKWKGENEREKSGSLGVRKDLKHWGKEAKKV